MKDWLMMVGTMLLAFVLWVLSLWPYTLIAVLAWYLGAAYGPTP